MREKVGKSRNIVFFRWFVAPEGRKVGSLKRRVPSQLARWEMKNCTRLWHKAHLQVKKLKTPHVWSIFGSWDVEKVHAVVARSTFASEKAKNTSRSEHFWKLRCRKSARDCGTKHISKSKCTYKALQLRTTFGSWDVEQVHAVVARSTFRSQNVQSTSVSDHFRKLRCRKSARRCGAKHKLRCLKSARRCGAKHISKSKCKKNQVRTAFGRSDVVSRGRRKGLCTFSKVSKTWGFCSISKNDGRRGTFEEDLQRCISRGRHSTKDMFIRDVRRSGRWFPEMGCILEPPIFRFAEMILRDRCRTSYDLASIFRDNCRSLDRWSGKIAKRIGTRALHSTFHFWRKSRRIVSFLILDVVNVENWGSLAELLRYWCCQVRKMKKSRRIVSFLTLSSSKTEEVSENCCVFDVVNFEKWRSLAELLRFWRCQVQTLRKSRRIAVFLMLSTKKWGSLAELLRFWRCQVQTLRKSRRIAVFLMLSTKKWGSLAELLRFWRCQVQT